MNRIEPVETTDAQTRDRFDAIIDVRSPVEFAEDHMPGAVNLPVLSNEERAEVGTIYKQESTFKARRIGAAYVSRNVACHLGEFFADKPPASQFLIYCWRGGMRSNAMATVVAEVGWRTSVLKGGYKTWRRAVIAGLRGNGPLFDVILVDGQTGAAKSDILRRAGALGAQVLDLEAFAAHRGSVFGGLPDRPQPDQKYFETLVWDALSRLNPDAPVLVEAESNRIGRCEIPKRLWKSMLAAPSVVIEADPDARAGYLVEAYRDIIDHPGAVTMALDRLRPFHAKAAVEEWLEMAQAERFAPLAAALMRDHYDPLYSRSRKRRTDAPLKKIRLERLDEAAIDNAATEIKAIASRRKPR